MEIAADTNLLVRYVTRDDPVQEKRARALFLRHSVFVPKTVLLELEWVLRFSYGYGADEIADVFDMLLGSDGIDVEDEAAARLALAGFRAGLDFADAMHLAACPHVEVFFTFDKPLFKRASQIFPHPVVRQP
jgi:predicted nucleic-acid-binding protein